MRCTTSVSMACSTPSGNWLLIASSSWTTAFCVGESIFGTACSMSASRADRSATVDGSPTVDRSPSGSLAESSSRVTVARSLMSGTLTWILLP